ncbi:(S)-benzoin forming benzil reductase [Pallidibacillus pasinlerensis]|uniref:(S)-benzoin forming benzil reductase n=1 Tax=Pallidibacillus pasinlerensis TaxID=2703818 RepID=A0ABX0AA19_9BACI|nr:(S)-benzoin forming benzil reductase [Pallidibacillus pasinlerensis]NCU18053.1 (S)-benzoin forming benzil reductase [Pallidibacillus pasinlerensis]
MNTYIITGASRGIGFALVKQLITEGNELVCVARTKNNELIELANMKNVPLTFLQCDLANSQEVASLMDKVVQILNNTPQSVTLINNAGVIEPIGRAENNNPKKIATNIAVNLTAPMILTSTFINVFRDTKIDKKVINISSGAGRRAVSGWSSYCTSKAGLDHFTRVIDLEQQEEPYGVKAISLAPGIIDTEMQATIRQSNKKDFDSVETFIQYKEKGDLSSPEETAKKIISIMNRKDFKSLDPILHIRDF